MKMVWQKSPMLRFLGLLVTGVTLFVQVNAQCTNTTFPLELTATSTPQYISSPDYPGNYPANSSCGWLITAASSAYIILNVETISLSEFTTAETCIDRDTLTIYDGGDDGQLQLLQSCHDNPTDVNSIFPTSTSVYLLFTSQSVPYGGRFNILYFANDSTAQPDCNGTVELYASSETGIFLSPSATDSPVACNVTFVSHLNNTFTFQFYYLHLQGTCSTTNSLAIYDGSSEAATKLDEICTDSSFHSFTNVSTTGSTAYMKLVLPEGQYGVLLTYFTQPYTINTCERNAVNVIAVYKTENYIESENFPDDYNRYSRCKWLLTAQNESMGIEVYFDNSTFELEYNYYCGYDFVVLYDGNTTSWRTQINRFCGSSVPEGKYRTTGNAMLVYFYTDYAIQRAGFRLVYKAIDLVCDSSSYPEYDATYNVNLNTTDYRNITSPNFDGFTRYPKNADVYWVFTNNNYTYYRMVVEIINIKLEWSVNCLYDRVIAYNGTCVTDDILGSACGSRKMRFDLYNEKHLVRFVSDGITEYKGFVAEYYIVPLPTPIPPTTTTVQNGPPIEVVVEAMNLALVNYSTENLPTRALNDPINATIDFYLVGINRLDEADQVLTTTGQFIVTWVDGNIAWEPTKRSGMKRMLIPQNDIWKPDIALLNGVTKVQSMGSKFMFIDIDYNGTCVWRPYQILESRCKVDMTNYPYDKQTCYVLFGSFSSSNEDILINFAGDGMKIHERFTENSVWKLTKYTSTEETINLQKVIRFTLTLKRNPSYVTFYISIPQIVLAFINVFTFTIPTGSGEKSGFAITVFLSFVVVLIVLSESMPDTSETISLLAAYIFVMTILSALATCITVIQIRVMTLKLFQYPIPPSFKRTVVFTRKSMKKVLCFTHKDKSSVERIAPCDADSKINVKAGQGNALNNVTKCTDPHDSFARYGNRRFSWLEDDDLYKAQSSSSGGSTSLSNHTEDFEDFDKSRETSAGERRLSKESSKLDDISHKDIASDNGSDMFSDEEDIEELIRDIANLDEDDMREDRGSICESTKGSIHSIPENKDTSSIQSVEALKDDTLANDLFVEQNRDDNLSIEVDGADFTIKQRHEKVAKRVTFKDDQEKLINESNIEAIMSNFEGFEDVKSANIDLTRSNTKAENILQNEAEINTQSRHKADNVAEILPDINVDTDDSIVGVHTDLARTDRPSSSMMRTKPVLSGNRPSSHQVRPFSRTSSRQGDMAKSNPVRTDSRLSNLDNSIQVPNMVNNPFTAPSMEFPGAENQPFSLNGRESRLSVFYPEINADLDVYEWEKCGKHYLDDEKQTEVDHHVDENDSGGEEEEVEAEITWEHVVDCSDVYLFVVYLVVTTVFTLAFFLPMLSS